ncbi:MAG TPA: glycosyl transferase family 1, partial [Opitutales bacterium]|nr:glycosyl transferase family 1 [Opitutales bacterium]
MNDSTKTPFLVVHPTGNTYVRHDLQALHEAARLTCYLTGLGFSRKSLWADFPGPEGLRTELRRRAYDLPENLIKAHPLREMVRLLAPRLKLNSLTTHETGWASVDAVFQSLDRAGAREIATSRSRTGAVLAYEDGAEQT